VQDGGTQTSRGEKKDGLMQRASPQQGVGAKQLCPAGEHAKSVVVVDEVVDVVVVEVGHPPAEHASQQLAQSPIVPPRALQSAASFMTVHLVASRAGTQQVTDPDRPHVDLLAQRFTVPLQLRGKEPSATRCFAMPAAHATYALRVGAAPQSQVASISARAAVMAAASPGSLPHRASAVRAATSSETATTSGAAIVMMTSRALVQPASEHKK
jgi:hypothetical protein